MSHETTTALWTRVARALRADAPPGTAVSRFTGMVSPSSWGGSFDDDGDSSARLDQDSPSRNELSDALSAAGNAQDERGIGACISVEASGAGEFTLVDLPASVEIGVSKPVSAVVLVRDALPEVYRRKAVLPEALLPLTSQPAIPTIDRGAQQITQLIKERMPGAIGASTSLIEAAEQQLGIALPSEVRALYSAAASGELILSNDEDANGFYGFEIIPLDDADLRVAYTPERRFPGWTYGANAVAETAPSGAVQPLAGSPYWFPIAHDWGGNVYAVDLAPGPQGIFGQVLFLDHEASAGAVRIATSLSELLLGDEAPRIPRASAPNPVVYVNDRSDRTIVGIADQPVAALNIGRVAEPVDLGPVLEATSPTATSLRSLEAARGSLTSPQQIAGFTGLEYLKLAPAEWKVLFEHDAVPPTLLAASVSGGDLLETVELSNRLLAAWSQPLIHTAKTQFELGPETFPSAVPQHSLPEATSKPQKRGWFKRR